MRLLRSVRCRVDYYQDTRGFTETQPHKNMAVEEPPGNVLLPADETIIITVKSSDDLISAIPNVSLYGNKVTGCEILSATAKAKDMTTPKEVADVQVTEDSLWQVTVLVAGASDIAGVLELAVCFSTNSESNDLCKMSGGVPVT